MLAGQAFALVHSRASRHRSTAHPATGGWVALIGTTGNRLAAHLSRLRSAASHARTALIRQYVIAISTRRDRAILSTAQALVTMFDIRASSTRDLWRSPDRPSYLPHRAIRTMRNAICTERAV